MVPSFSLMRLKMNVIIVNFNWGLCHTNVPIVGHSTGYRRGFQEAVREILCSVDAATKEKCLYLFCSKSLRFSSCSWGPGRISLAISLSSHLHSMISGRTFNNTSMPTMLHLLLYPLDTKRMIVFKAVAHQSSKFVVHLLIIMAVCSLM